MTPDRVKKLTARALLLLDVLVADSQNTECSLHTAVTQTGDGLCRMFAVIAESLSNHTPASAHLRHSIYLLPRPRP